MSKFELIMREQGYWNNLTNLLYLFPSRAIIIAYTSKLLFQVCNGQAGFEEHPGYPPRGT